MIIGAFKLLEARRVYSLGAARQFRDGAIAYEMLEVEYVMWTWLEHAQSVSWWYDDRPIATLRHLPALDAVAITVRGWYELDAFRG